MKTSAIGFENGLWTGIESITDLKVSKKEITNLLLYINTFGQLQIITIYKNMKIMAVYNRCSLSSSNLS
jgi:hypothetical protein